MIYTTGTGQTIHTHEEDDECREMGCVIHNPTKHLMSDFPTHWRHGGFGDIKPPHMERICAHGVGHPDPDQVRYFARRGLPEINIHGCDGCCVDAYAAHAADPDHRESVDDLFRLAIADKFPSEVDDDELEDELDESFPTGSYDDSGEIGNEETT